ncbi:MAG: DUF1684 domain-containing protein [Flavobacteriaceae bacterium]|nr:DUF1684 domain-containing protein [Flavobacteriaceae bacterium]
MIRTLLSLMACLAFFSAISQDFEEEVAIFQMELNLEYTDVKKSPLLPKDRVDFKGHPFFLPNKKFRVTAKFEKNPNPTPFAMKTTTERLPIYVAYGWANFEIDGKQYSLTIYQNQGLMEMAQYKDHLFLPFNDKTNGEESYAGGRYMDLKIPEGNTIVLDFNQTYHPLCAYNPRYSCPIPPQENNLPIRIEAGVRLDPHFKH